jgi:hypothetical protein
LNVPLAVGLVPGKLNAVLAGAGKVKVDELMTSPVALQVAVRVAVPLPSVLGKIMLPLKLPVELVLKLPLLGRLVMIPF